MSSRQLHRETSFVNLESHLQNFRCNSDLSFDSFSLEIQAVAGINKIAEEKFSGPNTKHTNSETEVIEDYKSAIRGFNDTFEALKTCMNCEDAINFHIFEFTKGFMKEHMLDHFIIPKRDIS